MKKLLIGIAGFARSGKDTSAEFIINEGLVSRNQAFAKPLKMIVNALFGWDDRHAYGDLKEVDCDVQVTPMQYADFLTAWCQYGLNKYMDPNYAYRHRLWKLFELKIDRPDPSGQSVTYGRISPRKAYQLFGTEFGRKTLSDTLWVDIAPTENVVIPDVRFPNEAKWVKDNGGLLIRINRANVKPVNPHESEKYIPTLNVDVDIFNNFSLEHLRSQVLLAVYRRMHKCNNI